MSQTARALRVTHTTRYNYSAPVDMAQHVAHLQPPHTPCQTCHQHRLQIDPEGAQVRTGMDAFGNHRAYFALPMVHATLQVHAQSIVTTRQLSPAASTLSWEEVRAALTYPSSVSRDPATEFVTASHHAPIDEVFAVYARASFTPGRPLVQAATALTQRMHREFTYASQSTDISTPAALALAQRRGVCQDFAHILIACLRSMGLAARYVSGYLLTEPPPGQPRLIGSDASHAWASVWLPDAASTEHASGGWLDLDPTNDRCGWASPGTDYVRLAVGRDFADVSPLRGVLLGGASHTLDVGVTVEPFVL